MLAVGLFHLRRKAYPPDIKKSALRWSCMPDQRAIHRGQLGSTLDVFLAKAEIGIVEDSDWRRARLGGLCRQVQHRPTHLHIRSSQCAMNHPPTQHLAR